MERMIALAPATWSALERLARDDDLSLGQIIRDAVDRELYRRTRAKKAVRPDERLIAPLRALLADDFAYALNWSDLSQRLARKGYALAEAGAGLAVLETTGGTKVCKASDLGYSHARLGQRLGPYPMHSHAHVVQRLLRP